MQPWTDEAREEREDKDNSPKLPGGLQPPNNRAHPIAPPKVLIKFFFTVYATESVSGENLERNNLKIHAFIQ